MSSVVVYVPGACSLCNGCTVTAVKGRAMVSKYGPKGIGVWVSLVKSKSRQRGVYCVRGAASSVSL